MSDPILLMSFHLMEARDELQLVHRGNPEWRALHIENAKRSIAKALAPAPENGMYPDDWADEWLVDVIARTISDVPLDEDGWVDEVAQARHIVEALFKHLKPEDV